MRYLKIIFLSTTLLNCSNSKLINSMLHEEEYKQCDEELLQEENIDKSPSKTLPKVDKNALINLLQKKSPKVNVKNFLDLTYEVSNRYVNGSKYGMAFCMYPEIMYNLIEKVSDKTVLEIGAASGINSILILLAGANKVVVNDIDENECKKCKQYVLSLPIEMQDKISINQGDFFDFSIDYKFDIILSRNLFHFFNKTKRNLFLQKIDKLLSSEGQLFISCNGVGSFLKYNPNLIFEQKKSFFTVQMLIVDTIYGKQILLKQKASYELGPIKSDLFQYENYKLIKKSNNEQYEIKQDIIENLDPELKNCIKDFYKDGISYEVKSVRLLSFQSAAYSDESIKRLLEKNGFSTNSIYNINEKGHVVKDKNRFISVNARKNNTTIYDKAIKYRKDGKYLDAIKLLKGMKKTSSIYDVKSYYNIGFCYNKINKNNDAIKWLKKSNQLHKNLFEVNYHPAIKAIKNLEKESKILKKYTNNKTKEKIHKKI